ncbi:jasmonate-induced oxygenase 4-like [Andrographis paniculata]|uniref:jasmonate-induced oxygenase 4-like n=1 Tax=Andrographis paniculata TaxID=175694 RepID=UPI0021E96EC1|nr:jasmonate-induced oxygenase 4-like [Andrographis paniculata]
MATSESLSSPKVVFGVQHLSESGIQKIPEVFVRPPSERPNFKGDADVVVEIPVIDMSELLHSSTKEKAMAMLDKACKEWGFFQLVNHGVNSELMSRMRETWIDFFKLSVEEKRKYAPDPITNEGYGSRVGVSKKQTSDWGDYFFLHCFPEKARNQEKWPSLPPSLRELIVEYSEQVYKLSQTILKMFSINLGLEESYIPDAFGGDELVASMQANYFPKCPQPDLTFGLSRHSDPGGVTFLIPDYNVKGLQVRRGDKWITINPINGAFIVNLGDKLEIISNAIYKSVEHRVFVNSLQERFSLVIFFNPKYDVVNKPADELVTEDRPALYLPTTFQDYKKYIMIKGAQGKSELQVLQKKN